jgi:glutamyl-tRNA reductase
VPLILVGLNHKSAPVEIRERLSATDAEAREIMLELSRVQGVRGATYLTTCNRAEALISADDEEVLETVVGRLMTRAALERGEIEEHLYVLRNRDVVRHIFRVAAGLDSMIVGEPQIGGQVRACFQAAGEIDTLDSLLQRLFEQTMRVAKKVRTETGVGEHAVSVPFAAVELARKIFGELTGLRVLLIGAGEMAELTARHLHGVGVEKVFVANRAHDRATVLAERFGGEAIHFDALTTRLRDADIVIASTGAPHYLVGAEHVRAAFSGNRRRELFLIDLAVPRNLDPLISEVDGAYLYNIDDLQQVADSNRERRLKKAEDADTIIEAEVEQFLRRLASHEAIPTIVELQTHLEAMRLAELQKCLRKLGPITTEQQAAVEALSTHMVNKILHYPILRLKESSADPQPRHESMRETIRRIFGLR